MVVGIGLVVRLAWVTLVLEPVVVLARFPDVVWWSVVACWW